jgi:phosphatidylglycerol:prolipoprotein diacylglycerol transferase
MIDFTMNYWSWGAVGFALGTLASIRNVRKAEIVFSFPFAVVTITATIYAGLFGTRLLCVASEQPGLLRADPASALAFWNGGLAWQGFVLGVAVLAIILRLGRKPVWLTLGCCSPGLALAHAVSRIGCLSHGCCYGSPTDLPWAIHSARLNAMVHPTQIYSALSELVVFLLLQWVFERRSALRTYLAPAYFMLFSLHRFVLSFFRGDPPGPELIPGLRTDQAICIVFLAASAVAFIALTRGDTRHSAAEGASR